MKTKFAFLFIAFLHLLNFFPSGAQAKRPRVNEGKRFDEILQRSLVYLFADKHWASTN